MSADYRTKDYLGYSHDGYVAVFDCEGDGLIGHFTADQVAQLQSMFGNPPDLLERAELLALRPDDVLIVRLPNDNWGAQMAYEIAERLKVHLSGRKVLVFTDELEVRVEPVVSEQDKDVAVARVLEMMADDDQA